MRYNKEVKRAYEHRLFFFAALMLVLGTVVPHPLSALTTIADVSASSLYTPQKIQQPAVVTLLFEAVTYTPPFYRGRALPSADASIRIHADAPFISKNGATAAESSINYTWTINGRVMQNLSGVGKSDLVLSGPSLYGTMIVSVDARSQSGSIHGTQTIRIPSVIPILNLYSDDSLAGEQYWNAITANSTLTSAQSTLVAEPYFFAVGSPLSTDLTYQWAVNGTPVLADEHNPSRLTLQVDGGKEGTAAISLSLSSKQFTFENTKNMWKIRIVPTGSGSTPFTNTQQ